MARIMGAEIRHEPADEIGVVRLAEDVVFFVVAVNRHG
jgi:hypothetical protein